MGEESARIMSEEAGRVWESKEEENFMEKEKEKVQPANRGAGEEQKTGEKACLSRDEQEMNHSCARDATTDGRKSISDAPEIHQRYSRIQKLREMHHLQNASHHGRHCTPAEP